MIRVASASRDQESFGAGQEHYKLVVSMRGEMGVAQTISDLHAMHVSRYGPDTVDFMWREMVRRLSREIEAEITEAVIRHGLLPSSDSTKR